MQGERFSLRDHLFNDTTIGDLADLFATADDGFDRDGFHRRVMAALPPLELKARQAMIARELAVELGDDFPRAAAAIRRALPPPLDPTLRDEDFGRFIFAPLGDFIVSHGMAAHPDLSLNLIEEVTQRFSMEFALRPFLNRWPDKVLDRLEHWAGHDHYHVRRLVSEGTRPRLPWGEKITLDPTVALPLLDRLHADPTRYVTRSVANHLNDIARLNPDLVYTALTRWAGVGRQDDKELVWITRHALRTLIKQGAAGAMALLGYQIDAEIQLSDLELSTDPVEIGSALTFGFVLTAAERTPVLVDFVIRFARPNGAQVPRVFKLKQAVIQPGQSLIMQKTHRFRGNATTFTLWPGPHRLGIQVNGRVLAEHDFTLTEAE